jgi:5-carboxymethyl-2-hydroxymuconate isomerase
LEYTSNLSHRSPDAAFLLEIHRLLESVAGIAIGNCKSRWREVGSWVVGSGADDSAFVHLDVRFMEGRPDRLKAEVGRQALQLLKTRFLPAPPGIDLQITVEIRDIRKASYFKDPPGTLGRPPKARQA